MLAAETTGSGDPVVFLHARVADRRMWRDQVESVGARYKSIAYDRRGFGETSADSEDFSAVADLVAVIKALADDKPVFLIGSSQGGAIALDAALQHPALIHALILIAPNVTGSPDAAYSPDIQRLRLRLMEAEKTGDFDQAVALRMALSLDGPAQSKDRIVRDTRRLFVDMNSVALRSQPIGANIDNSSAYYRLSEISMPSLVIYGDLDLAATQERSRYVAKALNGSSHVMHGVAHLPSMEQPRQVTDLLVEFINRWSSRSI